MSGKKLKLNLNPSGIDGYIGNEASKNIIKIAIDAAKDNNLLMAPILLTGPRGTGKTTLGVLVAHELNLGYKIVSANAIQTVRDMNNLMVHVPEVLILDEVHNLKHSLSDLLHSAIDNCRYSFADDGGDMIEMETNPFILIACTTQEGNITPPLYSRFQTKIHLQPYNSANLQKIILNCARNNSINLDIEAAYEIAKRSQGIPRIALLNMVNAYQYALKYNKGLIDFDTACACMQLHGIDQRGFGEVQRSILRILDDAKAPLGIENLAERVGVDTEAILQIYEPFLLQTGFLERKSTGRLITEAGKSHLRAVR